MTEDDALPFNAISDLVYHRTSMEFGLGVSSELNSVYRFELFWC